MCARRGRWAIEICLSEKRALAKKGLGNTDVQDQQKRKRQNMVVRLALLGMARLLYQKSCKSRFTQKISALESTVTTF